jgi:hypothetical protein
MMRKTFLISKKSKIWPTQDTKDFHLVRNKKFQPSKFQTYNDWFYFIHIDQYVRLGHAFGMFLGLFFFTITIYKLVIFGLSINLISPLAVGTFFFYFFPLLTHIFYEGNCFEGGTAIAPPSKFLTTLIPVIHINLMTVSGTYDGWLRNFIKKYPFIKDAWELEEKEI